MASKNKTTSNQKTSGTAVTSPNVPGFISGPYQSYVSSVADLLHQNPNGVSASPLQNDSWNAASALRNPNGSLQGGIDATRGLLNYEPGQVDVGQLSSTDYAPYMNPFQSDVIDSTVNDWTNANAQALTQLRSSTPTGAFNGSRQGVAEGQLTADNSRTLAGVLASLRAQNFNQAQGAAQFDIGNRFARDQFNANNNMEGARFRLGAAQQLGGLGLSQDANTRANVETMGSAGATQQANDPVNQRIRMLSSIAQLLGIDPSMFVGQSVQTDGTSSGTTKSKGGGFTFGWSPNGGLNFGIG